MLLCIIECGIGIATACVPMLKPLLRSILDRTTLQPASNGLRSTGYATHTATSTRVHGRGKPGLSHKDDAASDDVILDHDGILMTSHIAIEEEYMGSRQGKHMMGVHATDASWQN